MLYKNLNKRSSDYYEKIKNRILSIVLTCAMMVSLLVVLTLEEVKASTDSVYEPLILNSATLNASTVWGSGDTEHVMDKDGGFYSSAKSSSNALPDDGKIVTSVECHASWHGLAIVLMQAMTVFALREQGQAHM